MFLTDDPLWHFFSSLPHDHWIPACDLRDQLRSMDLKPKIRSEQPSILDVRKLTGVTGSKTYGLSWDEFRMECGKPRKYHGSDRKFGCETEQDADRLWQSLQFHDQPVSVNYVEWSDRWYWGNGSDGGSHRIAAIADWAHRNNREYLINAIVYEYRIDTRNSTLNSFFLGFMPSLYAWELRQVLENLKVSSMDLTLDGSRLVGGDSSPEISLMALPKYDAIIQDLWPTISSRKDWLDFDDSPMKALLTMKPLTKS